MTGPQRPPRLVHVTTADMSLALILGPQLRAMKAAGYEVIGMSAAGPHVAELESWGVQHHAVRHATRSVSPGHDILSLAEMWAAFRRIEPDIVHTHLIKPGTFGRPAAWGARVPVVVNTVHGLYATPDNGWLRRNLVYTIERVASRCSDAELVQNDEDLEVLKQLGVPEPKLHLLGNGIDLDRFDPEGVSPARRNELRSELGADEGTVVAGVVGRLVWEKGYREIFAAARRLRALAPQVRFVVVGPEEPGKADAVPHDEIARVSRDAGVTFLGMRSDVESLYGAFDVFVLASHREGFSRSGMEAAAMGLPIIAADVRGCRQVVDQDVTGLLFPRGDVDGLVSATLRLCQGPDATGVRHEMSRRAIDKARREFDQQRVIDITLDVYDRLLRGPSGHDHRC